MRNFKPAEFHNYLMMNQGFLQNIDDFRDMLGVAMNLTATNEDTGHVSASQHYIGLAVDFVCSLSPLEVFLKAIRMFTGVGYYSKGYWHIDQRVAVAPRLFWIGINNADDTITYHYADEPGFIDLFQKYIIRGEKS